MKKFIIFLGATALLSFPSQLIASEPSDNTNEPSKKSMLLTTARSSTIQALSVLACTKLFDNSFFIGFTLGGSIGIALNMLITELSSNKSKISHNAQIAGGILGQAGSFLCWYKTTPSLTSYLRRKGPIDLLIESLFG